MATKAPGADKPVAGQKQPRAFGQEPLNEQFKDEIADAQKPPRVPKIDFISSVLENPVYATDWTWPWLRTEYGQLQVHRLYLQMTPQVAVDTFFHEDYDRAEVELKRKALKDKGIRYVCLHPKLTLEEAELELKG